MNEAIVEETNFWDVLGDTIRRLIGGIHNSSIPQRYIQAAAAESVDIGHRAQARCNVTIEAATVESEDVRSTTRRESRTARELHLQYCKRD